LKSKAENKEIEAMPESDEEEEAPAAKAVKFASKGASAKKAEAE